MSWQAQHFVDLGAQVSWQAQHFVNLEVHMSRQAEARNPQARNQTKPTRIGHQLVADSGDRARLNVWSQESACIGFGSNRTAV